MAFRMYLTDTDHKVLRFVEEYGSITISQCQKIFYNVQNRGYEIARRRLSKLVQYKKLSVYKDMYLNMNVYTMGKKMSTHNVLALDYYAELSKLGVEFVYFKQDQQWLNNKYFSDIFCCYYFENKVYFDVMEFVRTKNVEPQKYIDIYDSGEAHELSNQIYKEIGGNETLNQFPRLIVVDEVKHKNPLYINDNVKVIQLDFKFKNISKLLV